MAPKDPSRGRSCQPSEEKPENKEPSSSSEEEESEEEGSESASSSSEEKVKNDSSGETGQQDEDEESSKSIIDSESGNQVVESDSDSDLGTPSSSKLQPVSRVSKSSSKRTRDDDESQSPVRSSKKPKSPSTPGGWIIRLWSDDDELIVLKGMTKFKNNTDIGAFYNFINGKLQDKFSKDQLNSKIKRLKKRFLNAVKKSKNGEDPVFFNPHEVKAFELSKKIWGGLVGVKGKNEMNGSVGVKGKNGTKDEKEALYVEKVELDDKETGKSVKDNGNEEVGFIESKYPFLVRSFQSISSTMPSLGMSRSGMCFALKRLSSTKADELNTKWKVLIKEEVELNHKKMTLMQEQMNTALDFVE